MFQYSDSQLEWHYLVQKESTQGSCDCTMQEGEWQSGN